MKKLTIYTILTYLLFTINITAANQNLNENNLQNEKQLKIGILLPLSGNFQDIGESFLKAIQLALHDISNENIKIYPKDSQANALNSYLAAKEFEELCIEIVIGPIFYESLKRLDEINNITFISSKYFFKAAICDSILIPKAIVFSGIFSVLLVNAIKVILFISPSFSKLS